MPRWAGGCGRPEPPAARSAAAAATTTGPAAGTARGRARRRGTGRGKVASGRPSRQGNDRIPCAPIRWQQVACGGIFRGRQLLAIDQRHQQLAAFQHALVQVSLAQARHAVHPAKRHPWMSSPMNGKSRPDRSGRPPLPHACSHAAVNGPWPLAAARPARVAAKARAWPALQRWFPAGSVPSGSCPPKYGSRERCP